MDFLDPKAKKRHRIRVMVGYVLMGVLISLGTFILLLQAYGFDVDRKTGEVIQNGLVFVDSAPNGATIKINNQIQSDKTNTRLALPGGDYTVKIEKDGYRSWQRSFRLEGGSIERFTYPLLIPNNLEQQEIASYDQLPAFSSESPDRRWTLISRGPSITDFVEYDLNAVTREKPEERALSFAANLYTPAEGAHSLELVEWANDNKHLLIKHTYANGYEYVMLNRDDPASSFNVTKLLGVNPTTISLRDKKFDQWYIFTAEGGVLQTADAKKVITSLLNGVGAYKSHDSDTLVYTQPVADSKTQRVMLRQGKQTYLLREISAGNALLDIARYDGAWYVAVGSDTDKKTYIYKDPFTVLAKDSSQKPAPIAVLRANGPLTQVMFSQNTRFISAQSGQHFEIYDAEYKKTFQHELKAPIDTNTKVTWMDGHRLIWRSQNKFEFVDFDGNNTQELVPAAPLTTYSFDRDYTVLYSINSSNVIPGKYGLIRTDLRFEQDR